MYGHSEPMTIPNPIPAGGDDDAAGPGVDFIDNAHIHYEPHTLEDGGGVVAVVDDVSSDPVYYVGSEMRAQPYDGSSQLTLSFRGQVFVFDAATPEKVQAVLLLLGGSELSSGPQGAELASQNQRGTEDFPIRCSQPHRTASLSRFRQKRKERCFDKKVRYSVRQEVALSGSKDGTCVFHTLQDGRYVRSLRHPSGCTLSKLVASRHGRIVFYADDDLSLHLYSINGKHLASSESNGRLNCVELNGCGEFSVCAGDQGQIIVRSMNSLEVIKKCNGVGKIITSLTVTPEECFLAGTKEGTLLMYSIENTQLRKANLPRNSKSKPSSTG